jgi:hypothetical protein
LREQLVELPDERLPGVDILGLAGERRLAEIGERLFLAARMLRAASSALACGYRVAMGLP